MCIKWNFTSKYNFSDRQFAKIYSFFVIESPVEGNSHRGKTFKDMGWNLTHLCSLLKKETLISNDCWFSGNTKEVEDKIKEKEIYDSVKLPTEIIIHTNSQSSKTASLFHTIRCAFAHGSFAIHKYNKDNYYFFENNNKKGCSGRIIIKEKTLLKWINIIENPKKYNKPKVEIRKKKRKENVSKSAWYYHLS